MTLEPIAPDTKDWTWTAERRCPECGFDASLLGADDLADQLVRLAEPWQEVLQRGDVGERPAPTTWSALEYACHVHEVLEVFAGRFELILEQENPALPNWDQDAAAVKGAYANRDPAQIAREIPGRVEALIAVLDRYRSAGTAEETPTSWWGRGAVRSDGAEFTALSLARYLVHDLAHHLHDVGVDRG